MKAKNVKIEDYQEFSGMMVHGTIDGIVFSEYVKIDEGQAIVERIDSNVKLNMQYELEKIDVNIDEVFDALEDAAQEAFKDIYVEAFDLAISEAVPAFSVTADKVTPCPWCLIDTCLVSASTVSEIKEKAETSAKRNAADIAQILGYELESKDGMPRIILIHGTMYNVYDVNNCLDVFGRCENGIDFEAIKEAFNRAPKMMDFGAFKDFAKSFEEVENA